MNKKFLAAFLALAMPPAALGLQQSQACEPQGGGAADAFLWQLAQALPGGVFSAAALFIMLGTGALFWRGMLPLCGAEAAAARQGLERMTDAGLLCGWLPVMITPATQPALIPWLAFAATLAACLLARPASSQACRLGSVLLGAAAALACGHCRQHDMAACCLGLCLALPFALRLCLAKSPAQGRDTQLALAAFALCAYAAYFSGLILSYPAPGGHAALPFGGCLLRVCAFAMGACACSLLLPQLRRTIWGQRAIGALALACCAAQNFGMPTAWPVPCSGHAGGGYAAEPAAYLAPLACLFALARYAMERGKCPEPPKIKQKSNSEVAIPRKKE